MDALSTIIPAVLIFAFIYTYAVGKIRTSNEKGFEPLLNIQCGGGFGWATSVCHPFVRHTLYENFLVISYGNAKYNLNYNNIISVTRVSYAFSQAIRYNHNDETLPKRIIIWSKKENEVLRILKSKNVNIKNV